MWQAFGTNLAKRAALNIGERAVEPGSSGPSKAKCANAQRRKVRRVGHREQIEIHANLIVRDIGVEVFIHPSGGSCKDQVLKRGGVQDAMKDMEGSLLRFVRMKAQSPLKLFKEGVPPWGNA